MSGSTQVRALAGTTAAALAALGVFVSTSAGSPTSAAGAAPALVRQPTVFHVRPTARSASSSPYVYVATKVVSLAAAHYTDGTIHCPSSHPKPVSGLFGTNSTGTYISSSEPNQGGWYTRIDNASTTAAAKIQIGVVCGH